MLLRILLEPGKMLGLHEQYKLHGLSGWYVPEQLPVLGLQCCSSKLRYLLFGVSCQVPDVFLVKLHAQQPVHQL
jgi:hypothetical protein